MASPENQYCANCIGTLSFAIALRGVCAVVWDTIRNRFCDLEVAGFHTQNSLTPPASKTHRDCLLSLDGT